MSHTNSWALRAKPCLDKERDVTFAKVPAEVGADLHGSHCSWVGAEGTGLSDGKIPKLPESSGGQCSPVAFPRLHKWRLSAFSLPCSPDQSWRRRAPLPHCSLNSTKLPFSPAHPAFLSKGSLTSPEQAYCLLHRSLLMENKSFLIACCPLNVPCLNKTDSLSIHPVLAWLPGRRLTVGSLATSVQVHLGSNNKSRRRLFPLHTINSNQKPFTRWFNKQW